LATPTRMVEGCRPCALCSHPCEILSSLQVTSGFLVVFEKPNRSSCTFTFTFPVALRWTLIGRGWRLQRWRPGCPSTTWQCSSPCLTRVRVRCSLLIVEPVVQLAATLAAGDLPSTPQCYLLDFWWCLRSLIEAHVHVHLHLHLHIHIHLHLHLHLPSLCVRLGDLGMNSGGGDAGLVHAHVCASRTRLHTMYGMHSG
jgi:hypothetical protein